MKKLILDTDLGSDCDDCGALSVIHNLQNSGKCELLGVMCNIANEYSPIAVRSINEWFKRGNIPIGQTSGELFRNEPRNQIYTKTLACEYLKSHPKPEFEDAVSLYRKILAENQDVTVVSIGFLNNLADLLKSSPDSISPLCGEELVRKSVSKIYIMGGDFRKEAEISEYNIRMDIPSAAAVADFDGVAKVYLGWEVGIEVCTGHTLWQASEKSPVRKAYEIFANTYGGANEDGTYDRPSWDPMTAWYAICDDESFMHESEKCRITFDCEGFVKIGADGNDTYIILDNKSKAAEVIEALTGE